MKVAVWVGFLVENGCDDMVVSNLKFDVQER